MSGPALRLICPQLQTPKNLTHLNKLGENKPELLKSPHKEEQQEGKAHLFLSR